MESVGAFTSSTSPLVAPPAPWWPAVGGEASACSCAGEAGCTCSSSKLPGEGWPDLHTVEYLTKLIVLGLLLLALPWLLAKVVSSPGDAMEHAAHAAGMK